MIELTEQQRQKLSASENVVIDPRTQEEYVLVKKALYEKLRAFLDDDDSQVMYPLLADLDPEDWEALSVYADKP